MSLRRVLVVAAVIERRDAVLVSLRRPKGERASLWEFPGGKVEPGEGERAALARELHEELGVRAQVGALYARLEHIYPDLQVELALYRCVLHEGEDPRPLQAQAVRWVARRDLPGLPFCEADIPVLTRLAEEGPPSPGSMPEEPR
ncbi:MAG: (deoxy)nucleoside triphosphate pyrophosphohydrolase [Myxococcales bacterium]